MSTHVEPALFDLDTLPAPPTPAPVPVQRTPVDKDVQAILDALWSDTALATDRATVVRAIVLEARAHRGEVDPNRVRARLAGEDGRPVVKPQLVGAVYQRLAKTGVLVFVGYVKSTDRVSGNAGRPASTYRLERLPDEVPGGTHD